MLQAVILVVMQLQQLLVKILKCLLDTIRLFL